MQKVVIIGGSGFIGSYITKIFLEENYRVKVSSTNINNKGKYEHLQTLTNAANLEVFALDVREIKMVEDEAPLAEATIVYDSSLAKKDLGIAFIAAKETLIHYV